MNHHIKTFLLGKDNEADGRQDALAVNAEAGLYVVADGVSNSYNPDMLSAPLCNIFVNTDPTDFTEWGKYISEHLLPQATKEWNKKIEEHLKTLRPFELRIERDKRTRLVSGASTFCAVWIDNDAGMVRYYICGDSTLYVKMEDGRILRFNTSQTSMDDDGNELCDFSNRTYALSTDRGFVEGEWKLGSLSISGIASLALMTDGMAEWFQQAILNDTDPSAILWSIVQSEKFIDLATAQRAKGWMDDDLAVILINLEKTVDETNSKPVSNHANTKINEQEKPKEEYKENKPEGQEPELKEPVVKEPEAKEPELKEPEAKEPEAKEPELKEPEAKEPELKEPKAKEPEVKEPEAKEPEVKEPEAKEPEAKEPEIKEPEAKEPELKEPVVKEPEVKEPEMKEPEEKPEVDKPMEKIHEKCLEDIEDKKQDTISKIRKTFSKLFKNMANLNKENSRDIQEDANNEDS